MKIDAEMLRTEIAALQQKQTQQIADLNVTNGALQVLQQLAAMAERPDEAPAEPPSEPEA